MTPGSLTGAKVELTHTAFPEKTFTAAAGAVRLLHKGPPNGFFVNDAVSQQSTVDADLTDISSASEDEMDSEATQDSGDFVRAPGGVTTDARTAERFPSNLKGSCGEKDEAKRRRRFVKDDAGVEVDAGPSQYGAALQQVHNAPAARRSYRATTRGHGDQRASTARHRAKDARAQHARRCRLIGRQSGCRGRATGWSHAERQRSAASIESSVRIIQPNRVADSAFRMPSAKRVQSCRARSMLPLNRENMRCSSCRVPRVVCHANSDGANENASSASAVSRPAANDGQ